jgi:hypothetical protein
MPYPSVTAFPGFPAQSPNSDANSWLEADGSGLPGRTTVDVGATGALAVVEVVANSVRVEVVA